MAVLAIIGSHLPSALRIFLLTLAVVDDLIAISIIAFFYSSDIQPAPLLLALIPLALYTFLAQKYRRFFGTTLPAAWLILLPLGIATWALVHASGIHATVAGVLLGFAVPVLRSKASGGPEAGPGPRGNLRAPVPAHLGRCRRSRSSPSSPPASPSAAGKGWAPRWPTRWPSASSWPSFWASPSASWAPRGSSPRPPGPGWTRSFKWIDVFGVSLLAGIGFTVSLLVAELSFGHGSLHDDHAKVGILAASLLAAILAAVVLRTRNRQYRLAEEQEKVDSDQDGIPDVYEHGSR